MANDTLTILNYPGSKKRLLDFIKSTIDDILPQGKTVLDIFCGTSAVGYDLKNNYRIMSNDSEVYCYTMARALVANNSKFSFDSICNEFMASYNQNLAALRDAYPEFEEEKQLIENKDIPGLVNFYKKCLTITQDGYIARPINSEYSLFTTYYSNNYFGLSQSMEIDSIRCAIESFAGKPDFDILLCCLYYAMKEVVFSKDGHMAQPLNIEKNSNVLMKRREKSIISYFLQKTGEFCCDGFVTNAYNNQCYNQTLDELLQSDVIQSADLIYADPPYTDMQYSRYFHLLETVTKYDYPAISASKGKVSTGLYRENRFQSPLSQFGKAKRDLSKLIKYCAEHKKILVFSYAYPVNLDTEKSDRYTMSINDLINIFKEYYGEEATSALSVDFAHCNNRNVESKKVYEFLIVGNPNKSSLDSNDTAIEEAIKTIDATTGTNNSPIYNSHLYWSQKPFNICDILLEKLSAPGDIVCDPFMGSGVTIMQSLTDNKKRLPIGIEINDYPIFLLKTLLQKHNIFDFVNESKEILAKIASYQFDLYKTICPCCGTEAIIDKTMFSYAPDGSKVVDAVYAKCPYCKENIQNISTLDAELFAKFDNDEFSDFENIDLIPDSRIAVRENETLYDIFTKRNIKAIDLILKTIKKTELYPLYIYSLLGIMHLCKITDPKSSSQWPLWTPNHDCVEKNVFKLFTKSVTKTQEALIAADKALPRERFEAQSFDGLKEDGYWIIKNGTQFVGAETLPDESVDLIITDPPYMGQVIYSEYMQLYKPFLKTEIEYSKEIIVIRTKDRIKTEDNYFADMNLAFAQISRFLKTGKYLCLYFHDANLRIWNKLISMLEDNNLQFVGLTHVNKGKSTLKNIVSPKKSMNGDAILFFKKTTQPVSRGLSFSEEAVISIAKQIITDNGGKATTAQLYDNGVLDFIIKSRSLKHCAAKYSDLTEIFAKELLWIESGGFWTIQE